jgi:hypothetical protein
MTTTKHFTDQMRTRSIHPSLVRLVLEEGEPLSQAPDRLLLTRRHLAALKAERRLPSRELQRAEAAVPIVCVVKDETLITTFRPTRRINRSRPSARRVRRCGR